MLALTIFYIVFGSLVFSLVCALVWALKQQEKPLPTTVRKRAKTVKRVVPIKTAEVQLKTAEVQPSYDPKTAQLHRRLHTLLQGDERTASRLISAAQSRYPGHDPFWYLDKVVNDLERDRRS
jgi:hypothetical protein